MDLQALFKLENETGLTGSDFLREKASLGVPYLIVICLLTVFGTFGNALVIAAVCINKKLRNVGNGFIVNLALADLCVTAFINPFSIVGVLKGEEWFEDKAFLCETLASVCLTSCFCSLLNIGSISFNRYIHICHNHIYNKVYTLRNGLIMCIGLWILCFLVQTSNYMGWGDYAYDDKTLACILDRTADWTYNVFFSLVGVATPICVIAVCYLKIFLHVRDSKRKIKAQSLGAGPGVSATSKAEGRESMRLARTLFVVFVAFAVCWTPYAITAAADIHDVYPQEVHVFSFTMAHVNSSLNCIVYGLTNKLFRRSYCKILHLDWLQQRLGRQVPSHASSGNTPTTS